MPTNYAPDLSPLRQIFADISDMDEATQMQAFGQRRQEMSTLMMFDNMHTVGNPLLRNNELIAISRNQEATGTQPTRLNNIYAKRANGTNTALQRIGTGGTNVGVLTPQFFDGIEEGYDLSLSQQVLREVGSAGELMDPSSRAAEAIRRDRVQNMFQLFASIYERANIQLLDWVTLNAAVLSLAPDLGQIYPIVVDHKEIPLADVVRNGATIPQFLGGLRSENKSNVFMGSTNPIILGSDHINYWLDGYRQWGANNLGNAAPDLQSIVPFIESRIDETPSPNGRFYNIAPNSLAFYQQAPYAYAAMKDSSEMDSVKRGNDEWLDPLPIGRGTTILPSMPPMTLNVKKYSGWADNSGTFGPGIASNDIVENYSFHVRIGAVKAFTENANESPIIEYRVGN